jgi:cell division protein FtsB
MRTSEEVIESIRSRYDNNANMMVGALSVQIEFLEAENEKLRKRIVELHDDMEALARELTA